MGILNPVLNAASLTTGMFQSRGEAEMRSARTGLAASTLEAQAARKELEADEALKTGELAQTEQIVKGRAGIARQKTAFVSGGVRVNEGSALDVAADKAAWSEYERQKIEYDAEMDSWGLKYDAALLRGEAKNVRAGSGSSRSSIASGISTVKKWTNFHSNS